MNELALAHRRGPLRFPSVLVVGLTVALLPACREQQPAVATVAPHVSPPAEHDGIGCLGHIEPGEGVVHLASRSLGGQASIIKRLLVKERDTVRQGQVVAELDSKDQLQAALLQAGASVEVARRRLAQAQTGAKPSEIAAQQAEVERFEVELESARRDYQRYASLGDNVTASDLDRLKLRVDSTTRALAAARLRLTSLGEVRPVDVDLAQAQLGEAVHNEARLRAEFEASVIHAPFDGRVIRVYAWPGEAIGNEGVLELAPIEPMYAVAEVSESDITRVKVGQRATISGDGLKTPLQGRVSRIGVKVLQNELMPVDPARFSDARVVEVWIKIDDGRTVADMIHMRVDVVIQP